MSKIKLHKGEIIKILVIFIISLTSAYAEERDVIQVPAWETTTNVEAVSPEAADAILKRQAAEKALRLQQRKQRSLERQQQQQIKQQSPHSYLIDSIIEFIFPSAYAGETLLAGNTAPVDAEITELARALKYDPDLIYEYVYNTIAYEPTFGDKKGAVGTLLDKSGNNFDQSTLMIALLRSSGYDARYIYGKIRIDQAQSAAWLGTDNITDAGNILSNAGIPVSGSTSYLYVSHVWVKVIIAGTSYYFDPSMKSHTFISGMDLTQISAYNENEFINNALSGARTTSNSVQHLNRANIEFDLTTYASNLISHIRQNKPDASLADVIGGKRINPTQRGLRQTALPYQLNVTEEWIDDIPVIYHTTLDIDIAGIVESLRSSEIYGKRLTITFDSSSHPVLKLDGSTLATGTRVTTSKVKITFDIDHPYAANNGKFADQHGDQSIDVGGTYVVVNGWGQMGQGIIEKRRKWLSQYRHQGKSDSSEEVLGESVNLIGLNWTAQSDRITELTSRIAKSVLIQHHRVGIAGQANSPYVDLPFNVYGAYDLNGGQINNTFFTVGGMTSALEHGTIEQWQPFNAVSTIKLLTIANDNGQPIYDLTSENRSSVETQLSGYSRTYLNSALNRSSHVFLPKKKNITVDNWKGLAYLGLKETSTSLRGIYKIGGGLSGGYATKYGATKPTEVINTNRVRINSSNNRTSIDPIDLVTGYFLYAHEDITIGSGPLPLGLGFQSSYNSSARLQAGTMGLGWKHSFEISVREDSSGFQGMGEDSPIDAAAAIVTLNALTNLLKPERSLQRMLITTVSQNWLMDQLTNNVLFVSIPGSDQKHVKLPDGSYNPSPGTSAKLIKNPDDSYMLIRKDGVVLDFDTDGKLANWTDLNGNTLDFNYRSNGKLGSISNNFNRTLTLTYDGGRISKVADGTGRHVDYGYDSAGNLISFFDAESNLTSFHYDIDGRMTRVYTAEKPYATHPDEPMVDNTYDTLDRVMTQKNPHGKVYHYYFAGTRSEEVDPIQYINNNGIGKVWYYDKHDKPIEEIDALGNSISKQYDGLQRLAQLTLPEGNTVQYQYDDRHNITQVTTNPKPGSIEPPIIQTLNYHPLHNKVEQIIDAKGNLTRYIYAADNAANLESIELPRPTTTSDIPVISYTYTAQGLVETETDPEDRITQYQYDISTGDLIKVIADFGDSAQGHLNLTTLLSYHPTGDLYDQQDPPGNITTYDLYDKERRLQRMISAAPFDHITEISYDKMGRITTQRQETGQVTNPWQTTQYTYTDSDKAETIISPQGHVSHFYYDDADRLIESNDAENRQTETQYDLNGRTTTVTRYLNAQPVDVAHYAYTANGQRKSVIDAENNRTQYFYDDFGRLDSTQYPDASFEQYLYDVAGNVTQLQTRAQQTISFSYDALNRQIQKTLPQNQINYSYDLSGLRTLISDTQGYQFDYVYDTAGRVISINDQKNRTLAYQYDNNGNRNNWGQVQIK